MNTRHGITSFLSIFVACFIVLTGSQATAKEGVHGIVIPVDGTDYYLDGPADGPNGEKDIPGHYWTLTDETTLTGEHYNTGPMGAESWWATKADNDVLLWTVEATIDTWTEEKANDYAEQGYVHYHELVQVSNGRFHPEKVIWLRHTAVTDFTFDGGPHPEFGSREVKEGLDNAFLPNGKNPYVSPVHGIVINLNGADYYLDGPADGPNGEKDIPGHYWTLTDENVLTGEHYNTGPLGAESWWATKAENDVLLWTVEAIIDIWTEEKANDYAGQGYVHYHELVQVSNGRFHPEKVIWLRHTAATDFTFDGGPHPEFGSRVVKEGVDNEFLPNGKNPYKPPVHGIVINLDGADYYLDGPADGPNGEKDIPGHYWTLTDENVLTGEHYNNGPMGAESWWATKSDNDVLLWSVEAIIDTWTEEKANDYAEQGYVHYHELVQVSNGSFHPEKVIWLRHTAVADFTFDGGPHPEFGSREVKEGLDNGFLPNGKNPYEPDIITSVEVEYVEAFSLSENYPNPFNPETSISFTMAKSGNVSLEVFNIAGQKIDVLKDGYLDAGHYTLFWDASNFTAGVYFYTLRTTDFSITKKMLLLK